MLVKFAVDPAAFMGDRDAVLTPLQDLIDWWEFFGVLVNFDDVDDALYAARRAIDPNVRIAWNDVLKANEPSMARPSPRYRAEHPDNAFAVRLWDALSEQTDAQSIARELIARRSELDMDLAVLEETAADFMGILHQNASSDLIEDCGGIEPTGLARAHRAAKFRNAKRLSVRAIAKGENHNRLWDRRFQRLAAYSSEIVIIDPYALHLTRFLIAEPGGGVSEAARPVLGMGAERAEKGPRARVSAILADRTQTVGRGSTCLQHSRHVLAADPDRGRPTRGRRAGTGGLRVFRGRNPP